MGAYDLWIRGQQIVKQCLEDALARRVPTRESLNELRNIQLKLRELLRGTVAHVDGLDPDRFQPWRGPSSAIGGAWDLDSLCQAIAESDATSLCWDYFGEWKFYEDWESEFGIFMRRIDELLELEGNEASKGISLRDCGVALDLIDDELSDFVRQFVDSKKITAKPIGKCPNDGRANLYPLSEVLKNLQDFRKLDGTEKDKLRKRLQQIQRSPAK